jgi:hypothetical protein
VGRPWTALAAAAGCHRCQGGCGMAPARSAGRFKGGQGGVREFWQGSDSRPPLRLGIFIVRNWGVQPGIVEVRNPLELQSKFF